MSSSMISIAASGAKAAQAALDVTSQNIANASTEGYVRRSVSQAEVSGTSTGTAFGNISQYGVRVTGITRNADMFLQSEVRRTASDASRADTLVTGLTDVNNAVENSGVYDTITNFQSALTKLSSSPTDSSLRANLLENARTMSQAFNVAHSSLTSAQSGFAFNASAGVTQVNTLATNLAQLNLRISADTDPMNNRATLLDQRDSILSQMSQYGDLNTTFASNGTVQVQMGGTSGPVLVSGGTASTLSMSQSGTGAISYKIGTAALTLSGGSLAGDKAAMDAAITASGTLDTVAASMISTINTAQGNGVNLGGTTGQPMFSGTSAGTMAVALSSGDGIATAPSGASAKSLDPSNLNAMRSALSTADVAGQMNNLLFSTSSAVSGNTTTRDALDAIYSNAKTSLSAQSGVNLDDEAANLVRYQQAYQASAKVIQVASTLFDQLMQL